MKAVRSFFPLGKAEDEINKRDKEQEPTNSFHKKAGYLHNKQVMHMQQSNDPLHGKTLEMIVTALVDHFGWKELGQIIRINCFTSNPSIKSSLTFLRKTPWARKKVEELYLSILK
jgi:DNA-binding protein VF530